MRISQLQYFVESVYACSQNDKIAARHLTESGKMKGSIEAGEKPAGNKTRCPKPQAEPDPIKRGLLLRQSDNLRQLSDSNIPIPHFLAMVLDTNMAFR